MVILAMKKYKAAIIGTGRIGYLLEKDKKREQPASHSSAFSKNKRITLVAGCDVNKSRLELFKKDYKKCNCYSDYKVMMAKEKPDIVVIAVPEKYHTEIAIEVFKFKPQLVVLEKPVATTLDQANKIKREAEKYDVKVLVNHERRYALDYKFVKSLLKDSYIGEISLVIASLWSNTRVFSKKSINDASCMLLHDATHLVDIIHYLFDITLKNPEIDSVIKKRDEVVNLYINYKLGKNSLLFMDLSSDKNYFGFEIEIRGSKGRIIIGNGYLKVYKSMKSRFYSGFFSLERIKKIKRLKKSGYFTNMVDNCVNFLDGKEEISSPLSEGIKTLKSLYSIVDKLIL